MLHLGIEVLFDPADQIVTVVGELIFDVDDSLNEPGFNLVRWIYIYG